MKRFEKVLDTTVDPLRAILYRSVFAGTKVVFVPKDTPIVSASLIISTKANGEDGLPHILEHLTFMGSKNYPFKGYLDSLANLAFSDGATNASTFTDYTEYTVSNACPNGLLAMLRPYLDHLFNPLLLDAAFVTEVHHVDEEGNDGGVVFSELQADESNPEEMIQREKRRLVYNEGHPFRFCSGGTTKAIRNCKMSRIKAFHDYYYKLPNLLVFIYGTIDADPVLKILTEFEDQLGYREPIARMRGVFADLKLPITYPDKVSQISFSSKDDVGIVGLFFQGPAILSEEYFAVDILCQYFCEGNESSMEQKLVESENPMCSEVTYEQNDYRLMEFGFHFSGVPAFFGKNPNQFRASVLEVIRDDEIDNSRIQSLLYRSIRQFEYDSEGNCVDHLSSRLALYKNYGHNVNTVDDDPFLFEAILSDAVVLRKLLERPIEFWRELVGKYFLDTAVCVSAVPRFDLLLARSDSEENFLRERRDSLGEGGLVVKGAELQEAFRQIEQSAPPLDLVRANAVQLGDVHLYEPSRTMQRGMAKSPVIMHHVKSNFVTVKVMVVLTSVPLELKKYISLYIDTLAEMDALIDGKMTSHEEVSSLLKSEFIDYNIQLGIGGDVYSEHLVFTFVMYPGEYRKIAKWMTILVKNQIYTNKRVNVACKRLLGNATEMLYDGENILDALVTRKTSIPFCMNRYMNPISGMEFYSQFKKDPKRADIMKEVALHVSDRGNNIHIFGTPENIQKNIADLNTCRFGTPEHAHYFGLSPYHTDIKSRLGLTYVSSCDSGDSSYLKQMTPLPIGYLNPDFVMMMIYAQYLSMTEGPLWKGIRGKGLAYGVHINVVPGDKIELSVYRASKLLEAIDATEAIIRGVVDNGTIPEVQFLAAKNSLMAELIAAVATPRAVCKASLFDHLRGVEGEKSYTAFALEVIKNASTESVLSVSRPYFMDLINPRTSFRALVVPTTVFTDLKIEQPTFDFLNVKDLGF